MRASWSEIADDPVKPPKPPKLTPPTNPAIVLSLAFDVDFPPRADPLPNHLDLPQFLGLLAIMLASAKVGGFLAQRIGQPAVLGELLAGVVLGSHSLGIVNAGEETIHLMGELGVVVLLFSIGLETELAKLLKVGAAAASVAIVGVILPFVLGYAACRALGLANLPAIMAGAALTATSVGITARVLADLGQLHSPEGRVVLGAAIFDDVVGLVILGVVADLARGAKISVAGVATSTALAFGFLIATLVLGRLVLSQVAKIGLRGLRPGTPAILGLILALGLAWLADHAGSAVILGAFAAGLLLAGTPGAHDIETGIARLGHVFVPIFFVTVGAAVDVRVLNPMVPANRPTLLIAAVLTTVGVLGKFLAGYAPFWFRGRKALIGVAMIPRGEVGLIFAGIGRANKVFDAGLYAAITLVVLITTFLAPPLLRALAPRAHDGGLGPVDPEGIEDLTN